MTKKLDARTRDPFNDPKDFLKRGEELVESPASGLVRPMIESVLARNGDDPLWQALANRILRHDVPDFHLDMLHDADRNRAYRKAIEHYAPGKVVLDIGTGSGLLAMMAARAGAARVIACEANPLLAETAKAIIEANGLTDRITVIGRPSTALDADRDLGGRVDLIVSELFSTDLLYEDVLKSLSHARKHLAAPHAVFVPLGASIMVALARLAAPAPPSTRVEGFDLSAFASHFYNREAVRTCDGGLELVSEPRTLFEFPFDMSHEISLTGRNNLELESTGGHIDGVAQWIELQFGDGNRYENAPGVDPAHHWWINVTECKPHGTAPGDRLTVGGWFSKAVLECWVESQKP